MVGSSALDPVEYKSAQLAPGVVREHVRGEKHAQFLRAARDPAWGRAASRCGRWCVIVKRDELTWVHPVLCDAWACALCGPRRAAWLIRQVKQAQVEHELRYFVTLTVWTESCAAEESQKRIKGWWDNLNRWLKRTYGPYAYIWTMELTQQGYAHLHVLMSVRPDHAKLSAAWERITGGSFIVDVELVDSERAASYLAKYCSQEAVSGKRLPGSRFFGKSAGVKFEPFRTRSESEQPGVVYHRPFWPVLEALAAQGVRPKQVKVQGTPYAAYSVDFDMVESNWCGWAYG